MRPLLLRGPSSCRGSEHGSLVGGPSGCRGWVRTEGEHPSGEVFLKIKKWLIGTARGKGPGERA